MSEISPNSSRQQLPKPTENRFATNSAHELEALQRQATCSPLPVLTSDCEPHPPPALSDSESVAFLFACPADCNPNASTRRFFSHPQINGLGLRV
jgi:hypothetical protein